MAPVNKTRSEIYSSIFFMYMSVKIKFVCNIVRFVSKEEQCTECFVQFKST